MRLIDVHTMLLEEFLDVDTAPKYAILSHTWGQGEVSLQEFLEGTATSKEGYRKVEGCC